jgi:hypothetical protein
LFQREENAFNPGAGLFVAAKSVVINKWLWGKDAAPKAKVKQN